MHTRIGRIRIACWYAAGALACAVLAWMFRPWGLALVWPGGALAVVAAGYFGAGPGIFLKRGGRIPLLVHVVFGPYLLGLWLSRCWFARNTAAYRRVAPGVLRGRLLSAREGRVAIEHEGIVAVVDLTAEHTEAAPFRGLPYLNIPVLDLTPPSTDAIENAIHFIDRHRGRGVVYVHCGLGRDRSAAVTDRYGNAGCFRPRHRVQ